MHYACPVNDNASRLEYHCAWWVEAILQWILDRHVVFYIDKHSSEMDYGCVKNGIGKMNRSILLSPEKLTKLGGKLYPHIVPEQTIIGSVSFLVAGMSVYVRTCQSLLYIRRTGMGSVYCVYMILYMGGGEMRTLSVCCIGWSHDLHFSFTPKLYTEGHPICQHNWAC